MSLPKFLLAKPERFAMRVATAAALIIGLTAIAMGYNPNASHPFLLIFPIMLVISGVLAGFTCILSLFIILREGRSTLADLTNLALCGFCSLLCLVQVLYLKWPMSLWLIYACTVLALLGVILTLNEQLTRALSLHYPERISLALIIGISNLGLAIWETRFLNFQGIEEPLLRVTRNFYFSMVCHPLLSLLVQSLTHQKNEWNIGIKIRQRLLTSLRRNPDRLMTYASQWFACLLSAAICQWILITASPDSLLQPWLGSRIIWPSITLVWMPALYMQHSRWQKALTIPRKIRSQLMQTGDRAEDFLHKHHMPRASQETWLGLRTAVLMIDHDPHEECRNQLPGLLYRARQQQCQQIVSRIFDRQLLSTHVQGSQLMLSMDPDQSIASCTDALLILTVLYLDGLPLVEKRLKQLVRLLPLLDIELSKILSESKVDTLFGRLQGFFHLDYNWIDQSMQSDQGETSFDVRLENLNPKERQRVLSQLSSAQWLGNFIWISETARDRMKSESPYLSSVIERWPIQLEKNSGKNLEAAVFLIKFEKLIPRLQRYHGLDELRNRLAALPIPMDSQQLISEFEDSFKKELGRADLKLTFERIREHSWRGFRAKDVAIELILKTVNIAEQLEKKSELASSELEKVKLDARELIKLIGYPSQELHKAHMSKLQLRQLHELQRICMDTKHPRCREAWQLIASIPTRHLSTESVLQLLQVVASACKTSTLWKHDIILPKAIEAFFQFSRALPLNRQSEVQKIFDTLARTLIEVEADSHLLLGFMDGKLALDQHHGNELHLSPPVLLLWKALIDSLLKKPDLPLTARNAIEIRWRSFANSPQRSTQEAS